MEPLLHRPSFQPPIPSPWLSFFASVLYFLRPRGRRGQEAISFPGPLGIPDLKILELESRRELEGAGSPEAESLTGFGCGLPEGVIEQPIIVCEIGDVEHVEDFANQLQ